MTTWTLSRRIMLICMGLGMLTVIQGFLSLNSMYRTKNAVKAMNQDTYATLYLAGKLKGVAKDQRIAIIMHLNAQSEEDMNHFEAQVKQAQEDLRQIREDHPKFDPQDRDALTDMGDAQDRFYQVWLEMKDLSRAGKKQEAWTLYNTKLQSATLARRADEDLLASVDKKRGDLLTKIAMEDVTQGIPQVWAVLLITVLLGSGGAMWFSRMVNRSIKPLEAAIQSLGKGVLSGSVDIHSTDDIGFMASYMNNALEQMTCTVSGIDFCNDKITSATKEIHSRTAQAAQAAITQRDRIRQIGDSMQEMVDRVHQVSDDSSNAASSAHEAIVIARKGGAIMHDALVNMQTIANSVKATAQKVEELGRSSDQIGRIVAVINEIAEQTNLLALNAAIEAARAGDQGRGFAVVAGEVRRLAERTGAATKEIAQMIQTVQSETREAVNQMKAGTQQVEAGVETTAKAGSSLEEIIAAAQNLGGMISRISDAASQQGGSAKQINTNLEQIAQLTGESAAHIQESNNSCENLAQLTQSMKKIISQFQFRQIISDSL